MRLCRIALAVLGFALLAAPAFSVTIIDNFEAGPFTLVDTSVGLPGLPSSAEQTGLATTDVIGGTRLIRVTATAAGTLPVGTGSAILGPVLTAGDDSVVLTTDAIANMRFFYDGIGGGSVASGNAGALGLDLSGVPDILIEAANVVGAPSVRIRLWDSANNQLSGLVFLANGTNAVSISGLTLDLSDIQQIEVAFNVTPNNLLQVSNISFIPEPGTGLLLGGGLALLAARRRARSA